MTRQFDMALSSQANDLVFFDGALILCIFLNCLNRGDKRNVKIPRTYKSYMII